MWNEANLTEWLIKELRRRGIVRVACWEHLEGVSLDELRGAGIETATDLDAGIRVGITGCSCAMTDTGTLLITSEPGSPLGASLLPETHIAVVHREQLVSSLEEAMRLPELWRSSASVFITGPSRTADIEMTLTIGVHGPKELLVILVAP